MSGGKVTFYCQVSFVSRHYLPLGLLGHVVFADGLTVRLVESYLRVGDR